MFNENIKSIIDLVKAFPTEQSCINHLEITRWNGNIISPFDSASKVYRCKDNKYQCKNTGKYFNVKTGSMFDNSKIDLQRWFMAIWLVTSHKKGISSLQLHRDINVTQKTAWFMLQRIRNCFGMTTDDKMNGTIEVDETFIGGDNKNKSNSKRKELHAKGNQTGGNHMKPVLGILERDGNVKGIVIDKAIGKEIKPHLYDNIANTATVVTDGFGGYSGINKSFSAHQIVYHNKSQYVNGIYHTNSVEGFWSLLKRGIYGIYHSVSPKHLQKYVDEFSYRYNTRKTTECDRFNNLLSNMNNKLTYKTLIHG